MKLWGWASRGLDIEPLDRFQGFSTWPGAFPPILDEDIESWFLRIALANGQSPSMLLTVMGSAGFKVRATGFRARIMVDDVLPILDYLAEKTGIDAHHLWCRGRIADGIFRRGCETRLCPYCLVEDEIPYARRQWQLPFVIACTKHDALLLHKCPHCEAPFRLLERSVMIPIETCEWCRLSIDKGGARYRASQFHEQAALEEFVLFAHAIDRRRRLFRFFATILRFIPREWREGRRHIAVKDLLLEQKLALSSVYTMILQHKLEKGGEKEESPAMLVLLDGLKKTLIRLERETRPPRVVEGMLIDRIGHPKPDPPDITLYELLSAYGPVSPAPASPRSGPSRDTEPAAR